MIIQAGKVKTWRKLCLFIALLFFSFFWLPAQNIDSLKIILEKKLSKQAYCDTLNELAYSISFDDHVRSARYLDEAEKRSKDINYDKGVETSKKYRAHLASLTSDFKVAEKIYLELIDIHLKKKNTKELYKIYNNLSIVYTTQGDFETGMFYLLKVQKCIESLNDPEASVVVLTNIANLYGRMGSYNNQYEYLVKALNCKFSGNNQWVTRTLIYVSLGNYYTHYQQHDSAIKYMLLAEQNALKDVEGRKEVLLADVYQNLGFIAIAKGDNKLAKNFLEKALEKYRITDGKEGAATACISLASVYYNEAEVMKDGDPEKRKKLLTCKRIYDSAQVIAGQHSLLVQLARIYKYKPSVLYKLGHVDSAYWYLYRYTKLNDSLMSVEKEVKVKELQLRYETEKREKDLLALQKLNAESKAIAEQRKAAIVITISVCVLIILGFVMFALRSRINKKRLSAEFSKNKIELEHKALRAQMNPHFLFNSLNSIQRMFVEGKTDAANEVMADFSSLLRRILNNSGKNTISLKEELDTLKLYLEIEKIRCDNCFEHEIILDESVDRMNTNVPPLVIQPFVENAIWHGVLPKKTNGKIKIRITEGRDKNYLTCIIEDNGVGFNKHKVISLESKGITITEQRLGTKALFEDPENGGTRVILNIPVIT